MRKILIAGLFTVILILAVAAVKGNLFKDPVGGGKDVNGIVTPAEPEPEAERDIRTAAIAAVGDMFPHRPMLEQAHLGSGDYDFTPSFKYIAPYLQAADFSLLNLETAQAGPEIELWGVAGYTGHMERGILTFNAPIELSRALKEAGIDMYTTANNHSLDRGVEGLKATLENVRGLGILTTGTYLTPGERDTPVIEDINGIKVAFISYTYGTNGIPVPAGHEYSVNLVPNFRDISPVIADIKSARAAGADLVAVFPHWGAMYVFEPTQRMREQAAEMAAAGADLILCGHAHVLQPLDWIYTEEEDGSRRPTLVAYSLGNFFTNQQYSPPSITHDMVEYGLFLQIEFSKDMENGDAWISGVDYEIHWCDRERRHRILVLSEVFENGPEKYNISASLLETLKDRYQQNLEILERYGFWENTPPDVDKSYDRHLAEDAWHRR